MLLHTACNVLLPTASSSVTSTSFQGIGVRVVPCSLRPQEAVSLSPTALSPARLNSLGAGLAHTSSDKTPVIWTSLIRHPVLFLLFCHINWDVYAACGCKTPQRARCLCSARGGLRTMEQICGLWSCYRMDHMCVVDTSAGDFKRATGTSLMVQWVKNQLLNAGDTCSMPGPERSHMPRN